MKSQTTHWEKLGLFGITWDQTTDGFHSGGNGQGSIGTEQFWFYVVKRMVVVQWAMTVASKLKAVGFAW